jgi:uncharacterized phage-like protein YoqJ
VNELISKTVGFTGHRPSKTSNNYSLKHPMSIKINQVLTPIIEDLIESQGITRFISGGALGFDQIAFWTVQRMKVKHPEIKNILSIPFVNQPSKWTDKESLHFYNKMMEIADEIIYVDELPEYTIKGVPVGHYHIAKMQKRNEHMVNNSRIMVSLYDGSTGGTGNCVNYLRKVGRVHYWINPDKNFELHIENAETVS